MATHLVTSLLECPICFDRYNGIQNRPRILSCGHTFCTLCLFKEFKRKHLKCPTCRRDHKYTFDRVDDITENFTILSLMDSDGGVNCGIPKLPGEPPMHKGICPNHATFRLFYCNFHELFICNQCSMLEHEGSENCCVVHIDKIFNDQKKQELHILNSALNTTNSSLIDLQKTTRELKNKEMEIKRKIEENERHEIATKRSRQNLTKLIDDVKAVHSFPMLESLKIESKNCLKELPRNIPQIGTGQVTLGTGQVTLGTRQVTLGTGQIPLQDLLLEETKFCRTVSSFGVVPLHGRICTIAERIHVYCMDDLEASPNAKVFSYDRIYALVRKPVVVFLELTWNGVFGGRIYIQLLNGSLRGRQFEMLCTGEGGQSYKNTKFLGVVENGTRIHGVENSGTRIHGGDYETNNGDAGREIVEGAEDENISMPWMAGIVRAGGWRDYSESVSKSAQFFIRVNAGLGELGFCFGQVIAGLEFCHRMIEENENEDHYRYGNTFEDAAISDCGIVLNY